MPWLGHTQPGRCCRPSQTRQGLASQQWLPARRHEHTPCQCGLSQRARMPLFQGLPVGSAAAVTPGAACAHMPFACASYLDIGKRASQDGLAARALSKKGMRGRCASVCGPAQECIACPSHLPSCSAWGPGSASCAQRAASTYICVEHTQACQPQG